MIPAPNDPPTQRLVLRCVIDAALAAVERALGGSYHEHAEADARLLDLRSLAVRLPIAVCAPMGARIVAQSAHDVSGGDYDERMAWMLAVASLADDLHENGIRLFVDGREAGKFYGQIRVRVLEGGPSNG